MPVTTGSELTRHHRQRVRAFYDAAPPEPNWVSRGYHGILAHYYNLLVPSGASVLEVGCGMGGLLGGLRAARKVGVDLSERRITAARTRVPEAEFHVAGGRRTFPRGKIRRHHRLRHAQLRHRCAATPGETAHGRPCGHAADHQFSLGAVAVVVFGRKVAGPEEPRACRAAGSRPPTCSTFCNWPTGKSCKCSPVCFCPCRSASWKSFSTACSRPWCQPSA